MMNFIDLLVFVAILGVIGAILYTKSAGFKSFVDGVIAKFKPKA